ncbi:hypothetical protein CR513_10238, partial [Mucuna pruriens]
MVVCSVSKTRGRMYKVILSRPIEATTGCATDSASQVEEGSHPSRLGEAKSASVTYIEGNSNPHPKLVPFIIQVQARPVYNNNVVPWRYPTREIIAPRAIREDSVPKVTNIAETEGVTRSGRIFALEGLQNRDPPLTWKENAAEAPNKIVMEEEAHKFLKMICHNEYEILDQLYKTPAHVSLLSLLINSKGHHELLLIVLNDAHVPQDITPAKFGVIINNISTSHHLSFSEDEVPSEGRSHNQPFHIAVKCGNYMIARVLIDNGSSFNVMPKATLDKLYCSDAALKNSLVVVRAFDGSKQETLDPRHRDSSFLPTLEGQIHSKPTTNQCHGEKELMVSTPLPAKYVKGDEEALETTFQALEIVGTTSAKTEGGDPRPSRVAIKAAKVLISNSFQPGKGLGKEVDGMTEPVAL